MEFEDVIIWRFVDGRWKKQVRRWRLETRSYKLQRDKVTKP
jgi:hypothetical protein